MRPTMAAVWRAALGEERGGCGKQTKPGNASFRLPIYLPPEAGYLIPIES
jgi:hypothetical protein